MSKKNKNTAPEMQVDKKYLAELEEKKKSFKEPKNVIPKNIFVRRREKKKNCAKDRSISLFNLRSSLFRFEMSFAV